MTEPHAPTPQVDQIWRRNRNDQRVLITWVGDSYRGPIVEMRRTLPRGQLGRLSRKEIANFLREFTLEPAGETK